MKIEYMIQYSPEWWEKRRGYPTASDFDKIITPAKGQPSASQDKYIDQLIADVIRLDPNMFTEGSTTAAMRHGNDCEPEARNWYEMDSGLMVQQVGFCTTDDDNLGCSPDGLVLSDAAEDRVPIGVLELKCPTPPVHVGYLREGILPNDYKPQCHGHLIVTGLPWVDFVSYCPGFPAFKFRVAPDEFTDKLRVELAKFIEKYHAVRNRILPLCV